jgi:SpoVK/Ycf46/Vps4 family AAA+-type ATPase
LHALLEYFCIRSKLHDNEVCVALQDRIRDGMSGAEVENLVREALMENIRNKLVE